MGQTSRVVSLMDGHLHDGDPLASSFGSIPQQLSPQHHVDFVFSYDDALGKRISGGVILFS